MLTKPEQAHALEPGLVATKNNLALIVAHLTHNDTKAQQLLMEAQEAEPTNVAVISNLALLVCSSGQLRKADELLIRALALEPAHRCQYWYLCTPCFTSTKVRIGPRAEVLCSLVERSRPLDV